MKKVFIKYNPYKLVTEITVDGKRLAQNSKLAEKSIDGSRLQEWIEDLPRILIDEYNDKAFDISFHGTLPDYEDIYIVFSEAIKNGFLTAEIQRIPAKETSDKEILIDNVFKEILDGPFDELRDEEIHSAFQHAKSRDFEVCVVATMSAGKSTLINAMLGTKLMPSKQEACTAIITKIKDCSQSQVPFKAEVYDIDGNLKESHETLTYQIMDRLNSDKSVSLIKASGNIPFVTSDDVSLVFIDTPGPNNARDRNHEKVQRQLLDKSSKALVLYVMTGEFGTDDDNSLLKRVAESMTVGGKQSKDRFIFVINKLDDRKKEDGDTSQTLDRIRAYLKIHGIVHPNIFPAAALPALNLRMIANLSDIDEDTKDETEIKVRKLNRNCELHFETYSALPPSIRGQINDQLKQTIAEWDNEHCKNENPNEALIHTGIPSVEAAIRQYVHKYAKTAKIKNIVDTFAHKLEGLGIAETTMLELVKNQTELEKIVQQIARIKEKIDNAKETQKYLSVIRESIKRIIDESNDIIEEILGKFQTQLISFTDNYCSREISPQDVKYEIARFTKFAKELELDLEKDLGELIHNKLVSVSITLFESYRSKLTALADEIQMDSTDSIKIDPLMLMGLHLATDDFTINKLVKEKKVEDGEEWISNSSKAWYKPWTWFQEDGYSRKKYKTVTVIEGSDFLQEFSRPIQNNLNEKGASAMVYVQEQCDGIEKRFLIELNKLDNTLKEKLDQLKYCATNKEYVEELIKETEKKLLWLNSINARVESILDI